MQNIVLHFINLFTFLLPNQIHEKDFQEDRLSKMGRKNEF